MTIWRIFKKSETFNIAGRVLANLEQVLQSLVRVWKHIGEFYKVYNRYKKLEQVRKNSMETQKSMQESHGISNKFLGVL